MSTGDPVRDFLRDRGLAQEIVEEGAEGLVTSWEQAAREAELECYPFGIEDWLNDLDGRHLLHELAVRVPGALGASLGGRLAEADQRLRASTRGVAECVWGESLARRMNWNPAREWWYWRVPRVVKDDFENGS